MLLVVTVSACSERSRDTTLSDAPPPLTVRSEQGSTEVTLSLRPAQLEAGTSAELDIRVVADPADTIELDDYQRSIESAERHFEYRLRPVEKRPPVVTSSGKREWLIRYQIEFLLPGEYEFPPARVMITPARKGVPDVEPTALTTSPLKVTVTENAAAALSPDELRTLTMPAPVDLPRSPSRAWPVCTAVAGAALALAALLLAHRRNRDAAPVIVPAHEWASRMFAALAADALLDGDRVQEFFYRVSGIVRGYIERRFGVCAAEMTTEEFLAAASSDARFPRQHATAMDPFLRACDLVKYAKHEPRRTDAEAALQAAQRFVEETRARDTDVNLRSPDAAATARESRTHRPERRT